MSLPVGFPMLEFLVVDERDMLVSGLGADQGVFLRIRGGALPGLVSAYLSSVWTTGAPLTTDG